MININTELMFSSKTDMWSTPQDFFDKLNEEFNFDLDPCSTHENAKCKEHYTILEDRKEAYEWYYQLERSIPDYLKPFKELMKTYNKVKTEIMNYFLHPYTNAFTESTNNLIKRVEKMGN